jgi:hypothetical protein
MSYRVRIFLWNGEKGSQYMGEHELAQQPAIGKTVEFQQLGRICSAHVMNIAPANWDPSTALIPAVHVTEWQPTGRTAKEEKPRPARVQDRAQRGS